MSRDIGLVFETRIDPDLPNRRLFELFLPNIRTFETTFVDINKHPAINHTHMTDWLSFTGLEAQPLGCPSLRDVELVRKDEEPFPADYTSEIVIISPIVIPDMYPVVDALGADMCWSLHLGLVRIVPSRDRLDNEPLKRGVYAKGVLKRNKDRRPEGIAEFIVSESDIKYPEIGPNSEESDQLQEMIKQVLDFAETEKLAAKKLGERRRVFPADHTPTRTRTLLREPIALRDVVVPGMEYEDFDSLRHARRTRVPQLSQPVPRKTKVDKFIHDRIKDVAGNMMVYIFEHNKDENTGYGFSPLVGAVYFTNLYEKYRSGRVSTVGDWVIARVDEAEKVTNERQVLVAFGISHRPVVAFPTEVNLPDGIEFTVVLSLEKWRECNENHNYGVITALSLGDVTLRKSVREEYMNNGITKILAIVRYKKFARSFLKCFLQYMRTVSTDAVIVANATGKLTDRAMAQMENSTEEGEVLIGREDQNDEKRNYPQPAPYSDVSSDDIDDFLSDGEDAVLRANKHQAFMPGYDDAYGGIDGKRYTMPTETQSIGSCVKKTDRHGKTQEAQVTEQQRGAPEINTGMVETREGLGVFRRRVLSHPTTLTESRQLRNLMDGVIVRHDPHSSVVWTTDKNFALYIGPLGEFGLGDSVRFEFVENVRPEYRYEIVENSVRKGDKALTPKIFLHNNGCAMNTLIFIVCNEALASADVGLLKFQPDYIPLLRGGWINVMDLQHGIKYKAVVVPMEGPAGLFWRILHIDNETNDDNTQHREVEKKPKNEKSNEQLRRQAEWDKAEERSKIKELRRDEWAPPEDHGKLSWKNKKTEEEMQKKLRSAMVILQSIYKQKAIMDVIEDENPAIHRLLQVFGKDNFPLPRNAAP